MTKVITYGTYDLLHYGHIRLLERAKALGDYLIVAVTADDFDKSRGKINVQQSLVERVEAVRATGIADQIIIEEYEGQKIDDIKRYDIDIFTVGSDWVGQFDYLREYCEVVYLERTEGVSSSEIRAEKRKIRLGVVGEAPFIQKFMKECSFVNGMDLVAIYTDNDRLKQNNIKVYQDYDELLREVDAVYIASMTQLHYEQTKKALLTKKHVLCESPIALKKSQSSELFELSKSHNVVLMDSIKTAYATAYARLLLLVKSGKIGSVYSVESTCTSLQSINEYSPDSICNWGPTAMLPIFHMLGTKYQAKKIATLFNEEGHDEFTKISFFYDHAVGDMKVGQGVKAEGELIVAGTKGYVYVPAPWWKTDYFEIRYEDQTRNQRYFYQLDGEGIRYEIVAFMKAIEKGKFTPYIEQDISDAICGLVEEFYDKSDMICI